MKQLFLSVFAMLCMFFPSATTNAQHCHPGFHFSVDGNTATFEDQSSSDGTIGSWAWDFGDGNISNEQNPSHTYTGPGTYLVCLTITDADGGCTNHICHHVVVHHPAPVCHAAFSVHTISGDFSVQFTNTSAGTTDHTTYDWDFGDGTTSTEENPQHSYNHSGHYTICLTITDTTTGCSAHVCHTINVHHSLGHHHHYAQTGIIAESADLERNPDGASGLIQVENYPNPFTDATTLQYQIAHTSKVSIEVYDLKGKKMAEIAESIQAAGAHWENLQLAQLLPGNYMLKMTVNGKTQVLQITK